MGLGDGAEVGEKGRRSGAGGGGSDVGGGGAEVAGADAHMGRVRRVHRLRGGVARGGAPHQVPRQCQLPALALPSLFPRFKSFFLRFLRLLRLREVSSCGFSSFATLELRGMCRFISCRLHRIQQAFPLSIENSIQSSEPVCHAVSGNSMRWSFSPFRCGASYRVLPSFRKATLGINPNS